MAVVNNGLSGVSEETRRRLQQLQQGYQPGQQAQQNLQQAQANKPGAYQPGQQVQQAQAQLQQIQASKPQGYNSKYAAQLDSILQQIQNPGQFKYEFNGDNLFKAYADLYTQKGKQAALDVQGQAAGLTGGYGNSYGQIVGQQQYQQNLLPLYDRGMELQAQAYQRWLNDQNNKKDIYNILQGADAEDYDRYRDLVGDWQNERNYATDLYNTERNFDYGAYRDTVGDWERNRDYLTNLYNTERNFDYNAYSDMLNAMMNQANAENQDYWTGQEFGEKQRQFNENLAEEIRQADLAEAFRRAQLDEQIRGTNLDEAYRRDTLGEQIRQNNLDEAYRRDTLGEQIRQANLDEAYRRDQLAENTRQYDTSLAEQIRQADLDEAYRRDTLGEQIRQADLDEAYRRDTFGWQQYTDARDYEQAVRESEQKYASNYALSILENGQMPSAELLMAAGLSAEDAAKLIKLIEQTGGAGSARNTGNGNNGQDESFYDASVRVFKSSPEAQQIIQTAGENKAKADQEAKTKAEQESKTKEEAKKAVTQTIQSGKLPTATQVKEAGMTATDVVKATLGSKATVSLKNTNAALNQSKKTTTPINVNPNKKINQYTK